MTVSNLVQEVIKQAIELPAKADGFKRRSTHFYRRRAQVLQIINPQLSVSGEASRRMYINVGLAFDALKSLDERPMPEYPKHWQSHYSRRISHWVPRATDSWQIESDTCIEFVIYDLSPIISSLIVRLDSIATPESFLASGILKRGSDFEIAAQLYYVMGDMVNASKYLHATSTEFANRMNSSPPQIANRLGLTGLV